LLYACALRQIARPRARAGVTRSDDTKRLKRRQIRAIFVARTLRCCSRMMPCGPIVIDPEMRRIFDVLARVAPTALPVLLLGETGAGKEGAAEWVHRCSERTGRFVRVNCASLTESVIESELFGHERGAFTGALVAHEGVFEAADGGTLLLDEVGELGAKAQAKLLRVLETGEIVRVGSTQPRRVDVRVVAATHRDLPSLVRAGEFREDLYYRLGGLSLTLPPLRKRPSEVIPLAMLFLQRAAQAAKRPMSLSDEAQAALLGHTWPGNVRELRNVIARGAALCTSGALCVEHLGLDAGSQEAPRMSGTPEEPGVKGAVRAFERDRILDALEKTHGNQTRAAELLGVSRRTLTNKLNVHNIDRPRKHVRRAEAC
jgi:two-component system response regulator AtoC